MQIQSALVLSILYQSRGLLEKNKLVAALNPKQWSGEAGVLLQHFPIWLFHTVVLNCPYCGLDHLIGK